MLESKRRAFIFLSISFLLAIISGLFFLQKIKELNSELGGMTKIYVTATDIPSRTLLQPTHVKQEEIPNRYVNNSHVTNVDDLIDMVLVVPLVEGDIITKSMLKPVSNTIDENNRFVTIMQSERIQFDEVLEGLDRVDIIISHKFEGKPITEVFMKDVLVGGVYKSEQQFLGVAVEIQAEDAPKLIHMQNYADSMRILKANVGKGRSNSNVTEESTEEEIEDAGEVAETTPAPQENVENDEATQESEGQKDNENS